MEEELKSADRRKDEFLAMLAHELRNPLAPIRSGLDLLAMSRQDTEPIRLMQQQVEHLVRLVVDDNRAAAKMLSLLVSKLGSHAVQMAHDGPRALEIATVHQPEIILLDIGLPSMDGYEVARRLRQQPEFQQTLLVALTAYGQEEDRRRSREAGFDEHLVKPPSVDMLRQLLAHPKLVEACHGRC